MTMATVFGLTHHEHTRLEVRLARLREYHTPVYIPSQEKVHPTNSSFFQSFFSLLGFGRTVPNVNEMKVQKNINTGWIKIYIQPNEVDGVIEQIGDEIAAEMDLPTPPQ